MSAPEHADPAATTVQLLGPPDLGLRGSLPMVAERRLQLLALLAVHAGEWQPRERLAALFWPDRSPADARRNLRHVLHGARTIAAAGELQATEAALRWSVDTDLLTLHRAHQAGDWVQAVALRRGPLLQALDDPALASWNDWLAAERSRADALWRQCALRAIASAPGATERAAIATRLLAADPLDEDAVAALVAAERAAGREVQARRSYEEYRARLHDSLQIEPSRALRDLWAAPAPPPPATAAPADPQSLQAAFVGRRTELLELRQLLASGCRLVTVLGPGGAGKSRLAREVLAAPVHAGAPPPLWVELLDVGDDDAVWSRLAQALEVPVTRADEAEHAVAGALRAAPRLLLLDNAEHLHGLGAALDRLLDAVPPLAIVVTSRVRLAARHESLLPLGGLAWPDEDSRDLEAAASFDGVRLFELRARAAQRDFSLAQHLGGVIALVEAVAGMPLAIELAASWVRLLPPQRMADELQRSIDLLQRAPGPGAPLQRPEHASMRAVLDQAWALLLPVERDALASLAVFAGGFTLPALRAVTGIALPLLSSLVDKSLVEAGDDGRFTLHPLVAAYAAERLDGDPGAQQRLRTRHAEHFARELAALARHAIGDVRLLVAGLAPEFANACAAWRTAAAQQRHDLLAALVRALWAFFEINSRQREGLLLLQPALGLPARGPDAALARTRLAHGLSMLHHRLGEQTEGLALARIGSQTGEDCGDTEAWVGCVLNAGSCLWQMGDLPAARAAFERGVAIAREREDLQCLAWAQGNLAVAMTDQGEPAAALALLDEAEVGHRASADQYNLGVMLINRARVLGDLGRFDGAQRDLADAQAHCDAQGLTVLALYASINLGHLLLKRGDLAPAQAAYEDALQRSLRAGARTLVWTARLSLARMALRRRDAAAARAHLRTLVGEVRRSDGDALLVSALVSCGDLRELEGDPAAAAIAWQAAHASARLTHLESRGVEDRLARVAQTLRPQAPLSVDAALDALMG